MTLKSLRKKTPIYCYANRKATDGEYQDIAHPINSATRERIQNIILEKYEQVLRRRTFRGSSRRIRKTQKAQDRNGLGLFCVRKEELSHLTPAGRIFVFRVLPTAFSPSEGNRQHTTPAVTVCGKRVSA